MDSFIYTLTAEAAEACLRGNYTQKTFAWKSYFIEGIHFAGVEERKSGRKITQIEIQDPNGLKLDAIIQTNHHWRLESNPVTYNVLVQCGHSGCPRTYLYWRLHIESGVKQRFVVLCTDINVTTMYGTHSNPELQTVLDRWNSSQFQSAPHHWRYALTEEGLYPPKLEGHPEAVWADGWVKLTPDGTYYVGNGKPRTTDPRKAFHWASKDRADFFHEPGDSVRSPGMWIYPGMRVRVNGLLGTVRNWWPSWWPAAMPERTSIGTHLHVQFDIATGTYLYNLGCVEEVKE